MFKKKTHGWMMSHIIVPNFCNSSPYRRGAARPQRVKEAEQVSSCDEQLPPDLHLHQR